MAAPGEAAVFGADDRVQVPARLDKVAEQIGLLFNNTTRTICTAFCVADNVIATAAHCLARGQGSAAVRFADFAFARGFDKSRTFTKIDGHATGQAAQSMMTGDFRLRVRPPIDAANDWALVRLQSKACPGGFPIRQLTPAEIIAQSDAGRLFQVSYHRDWTQWRPAYSKPCRAARDFGAVQWSTISPDFMNADQMILHQCDTGGASSGSPMLMETPEGMAVVGINVGTYVQSKIVSQNGQVTQRGKSETVANTAVNARVFAAKVETLKSAAMLSGPQLRTLQELLRDQSHYAGRIDGSYGPAIKSAIETYEKARNLPVSGLATEALLARLTEDASRAGKVSPSSSSPPPAR